MVLILSQLLCQHLLQLPDLGLVSKRLLPLVVNLLLQELQLVEVLVLVIKGDLLFLLDHPLEVTDGVLIGVGFSPLVIEFSFQELDLLCVHVSYSHLVLVLLVVFLEQLLFLPFHQLELPDLLLISDRVSSFLLNLTL